MTIHSSSTLPKEETRTELALEGVWRVVVLNDPVNLMSYVVMVFKKVFGFDEWPYFEAPEAAQQVPQVDFSTQ